MEEVEEVGTLPDLVAADILVEILGIPVDDDVENLLVAGKDLAVGLAAVVVVVAAEVLGLALN